MRRVGILNVLFGLEKLLELPLADMDIDKVTFMGLTKIIHQKKLKLRMLSLNLSQLLCPLYSASVAEATKEDVNEAIKAVHKAFDHDPERHLTGFEMVCILNKYGAL
ncbi:hypothetical protein SUGI_0541170 [Cryptomeria japonica]|nr:hypothetical protein SUGI_0541170 [Cryptomeria japonica]